MTDRKRDLSSSSSNSSKARSFSALLNEALSRRQFVRGGVSAGAALGFASLIGCSSDEKPRSVNEGGFVELEHGLDENLHVARDHSSRVVLRWGDPLFSDAPEFDPLNQSAEAQAKQFGYNCDFTAFLPLPMGSESSEHGLLFVNHEYTNVDLMFPGSPDLDDVSVDQTKTAMMAVGVSIAEIVLRDGQWRLVRDSRLNRRLTPYTEMVLDGPAAGSSRLVTSHSPQGVTTLGTYDNCAGGVTPWGTVLTAEENVDGNFNGDFSGADAQLQESLRRFGYNEKWLEGFWHKADPRWDLSKSPNEPLHVGYIVEIDPYDPESVPVKHTALGRFKHEGANVTINGDGRVVAYSGDDEKFEYIYRFVSANKYDPDNRVANMQLLSEGTLSVARFDDTGLDWLPLVYGEGPLTEENGFQSQADICIDTRKAADLVGATPMDRPEEVEINPVTGTVFVMLTKNADRTASQVDAANPRAANTGGHIIELSAPDGDHAADRFNWNLFILAGNPDETVTQYHPDTSENGWFACPDNCTFDHRGNIWIATDGAESFGVADGIWMAPVEGANRGRPKRFLRTPRGAELCGVYFTPDNTNLFAAVQHPGDDSGGYDAPSTRWPDFDAALPPRPSVVALSRDDGNTISG